MFTNPNTAGGVQAGILLVVTIATFLYTINKDKVKAKEIDSYVMIALLGWGLGVLGSFLGIGGGPFNVRCCGFGWFF